jgi:hypothetical protein
MNEVRQNAVKSANDEVLTGGSAGRAWGMVLPFAWVLGSIVYLLWQQDSLSGDLFGFPSDDAWIHMTFGRNLSQNLGFGINPHEPAAGSTSVPWSLWLGLMHIFFGGWGFGAVVAAVKLSGILLALSAVPALYRMFSRFWPEPLWAGLAVMTVLTGYPLAWAALSGMEVPLTISLCLWAADFHLAGIQPEGTLAQRRFSLFLWILAAWVRPENLLLAFLAPLIAAAGVSSHGKKEAASHLAGAMLGAAIISGVHFGLFGSFLPNTLSAKMTQRALPLLWETGNWSGLLQSLVCSPFHYGREVLVFLSGENLVLLSVLLAGPFLLCRLSLAPSVKWALGLFWLTLPGFMTIVGWIAGPEWYTHAHGRYLAHTVVLAGFSAVFALVSSVRSSPRATFWLGLFLVAALLLGVERVADLGPRFAQETKNIDDLQIRWGQWLKSLPQAVRVGANDVGALAYFGGQRIIDLEGLCFPAAIRFRRQGRLLEFLESVRPDCLLIFPHWYPSLVQRPDLFKPLAKISIDQNLTGGGEEMFLFSTPWGSLSMPLPPLPPPGRPREVPRPHAGAFQRSQ